MTEHNDIPRQYTNLRNRWTERDERVRIMDSVVRGDWQALGPDGEGLENRSPNLVQVALEDTAETASLVPTVRVIPSTGSDLSKNKAMAMERLAASYLDVSQIELLEIQSLMDLAGFGYFVWVVTFNPETGSPVIEWRDPRTCYPSEGWRTFDSVREAVFARELYCRQLPEDHQMKLRSEIMLSEDDSDDYLDRRITVIEKYCESTIEVYGMYQSGWRSPGMGITWVPVLLESAETPYGICPVVIGQRPSLDNEPRGQFDQVIQVMQAHIRLMAMVLDYADQAVYSDVWVKDLVGQMSFGGGAYIQLGPQGAIGRVPPAVSSMSVQQELDSLVTNIHLGGRWPKSRPGEVDQAIASAKFIEATAGMMNTVIRTMHLVMKRALEQALRIALVVDVTEGPDRTVAGILRNQQFLVERKKNDIDLKARLRVDYGIGLGRDAAQTMVLGIQGMQTGIFSKEFVQDNFEGIQDVERERQRIDLQQFADMAFAQLMQGLQEKTIPSSALVAIAKERANGKGIFELFDKYIAKPQEEQMAAAIPSGLGGGMMQPGMSDPAAGGPQPPSAPPPEELMGALGGGEVQSIGRLSERLPGGGFAGTEFKG